MAGATSGKVEPLSDVSSRSTRLKVGGGVQGSTRFQSSKVNGWGEDRRSLEVPLIVLVGPGELEERSGPAVEKAQEYSKEIANSSPQSVSARSALS